MIDDIQPSPIIMNETKYCQNQVTGIGHKKKNNNINDKNIQAQA